jgi:DNA-binding transcriptional ArsR family regulator
MARPDSFDAQFARVLSHPLRPQILHLLTYRGEASPSQLATELEVPLGTLSYHIRLLRDTGWIEQVRTVPRRGAIEHFYRAVARPVVEDTHWERLPLVVRRRLAAMTIGQIVESVARAAPAGGFDRAGAHVDRLLLVLDEQGWHELSELLVKTIEQVASIQERSSARRSGQGPGDARPSVLAILHYNSLDETP